MVTLSYTVHNPYLLTDNLFVIAILIYVHARKLNVN